MDDQEVPRQTQFGDDRKFVFELFVHRVWQGRAVAPSRSLVGESPERCVLTLARLEGVLGEVIFEHLHAEAAALGDGPGCANPRWAIGEARGHFVACLEVAFAVGEQPPARAIEGRPGVEARQSVEQVSFFGPGCAHVATGHDPHPLGLGNGDGSPRRSFVIAIEVPRNVDPEPCLLAPLSIPGTEDGAAAIEERSAERCVSPGQRGEALGVFFEFFEGEEGCRLRAPSVLLVFGAAAPPLSQGQQSGEIAPTLRRLDQQQQLPQRLLQQQPALDRLPRISQPNLRPVDCAHAGGGASSVEARAGVDSIAIRQGEGRVLELRGALGEGLGQGGPFEEAECAAGPQLDIVVLQVAAAAVLPDIGGHRITFAWFSPFVKWATSRPWDSPERPESRVLADKKQVG